MAPPVLELLHHGGCVSAEVLHLACSGPGSGDGRTSSTARAVSLMSYSSAVTAFCSGSSLLMSAMLTCRLISCTGVATYVQRGVPCEDTSEQRLARMDLHGGIPGKVCLHQGCLIGQAGQPRPQGLADVC